MLDSSALSNRLINRPEEVDRKGERRGIGGGGGGGEEGGLLGLLAQGFHSKKTISVWWVEFLIQAYPIRVQYLTPTFPA